MSLECAICGSAERVVNVCHHCGRPLCNDMKNCRFPIADPVFGGTASAPVAAQHCRECWQAYHPGAKPVSQE